MEIQNIVERKVTLNLHKKSYTAKPNSDQTKAIQSEIGRCKTTLTVETLSKILNNGVSMKAAALNGCSNIDWESQEVFAIDIDNKGTKAGDDKYITIEDALDRCAKYNIQPVFYYTSFSHKEDHHKFRLVFISNTKITDIRVRNVIQIAIMNIFPECDKACKDLSRLFYGSKKGCKIIDLKAIIGPLGLIQAMVSFTRCSMSDSAASKNIKTYCQNVGLNMVNGLPHIDIVCDKNLESNNNLAYTMQDGKNNIKLNFNIKEGDYSTKVSYTERKSKRPKCDIDVTKLKAKELVKGFDFEVLENRCKLYSEFVNCKRWCYHTEVFGMATNLWRYNQGQQRMIKAIEENGDYKDQFNKINTIRSASKAQYTPMRCEKFCPYCDECPNKGLNMLHIMDAKRNDIRQIEDVQGKDITRAYEDITGAMANAIKSDNGNNKVILIKGPTGIGKSSILKLLANKCPDLFNNTVVAAPTHDLLNELVDKLKDDIPRLVHVKDIDIPDEQVQIKYNTYQSTGQYGSAKGLLEAYLNKLAISVIADDIKMKELKPIIDNINEYLEASKVSRNTTNPLFCTHKRMSVLNNSKINKYIVDEDIISTVIQNISLDKEVRNNIADAAIVSNKLGLKDLYTHFKSMLDFLSELELTQETVLEYPNKLKSVNMKDMKKLLEEFTPSCNLMDILQIKAAIKSSNGNMTGYKKNDLPNKPIIILSATANERVYRAIFSDREIEVVDIGYVEHEGDIILHYHGMSRSYLTKNFDKAVARIKEEAPNIKNIITYKRFSFKFENEGFNPICHYGKCTGIDAYGGQDLIVLGTPHVDSVVYLLMAHACGVKETITMEIEFTNIERNGYEFTFSTFNSHDLSPIGELIREIQFYLIESEIVQAVGRARALRKNCTVHVFSNYPLRGCKIY